MYYETVANPVAENFKRDRLDDRLDNIDCLGVITENDKMEIPGIHFCPEFGHLPVHKGDPAWYFCTCGIKEEVIDNCK